MATLWDIVTGNSTLAIDPGNTFWDHLNNQAGGSGLGVIYGETIVTLDNEINVIFEENEYTVTLEEEE